MTTIREERLPNGLLITFRDETNRYFGDYHRVCLKTLLSFNLREAARTALDDAGFWTEANNTLGDTLTIEKTLVRMGVPSAEVDATLKQLVNDFFRAANDYMAHPDYPKRLAQGELAKHKKVVRFS